jgi:membrane-associated phospholipid phosphatase
MTRTGLTVALTIAAVVGLVFGLYPELDVRVTGLLFNPKVSTYELRQTLLPVRDAAMWLVAALAAPAGLALLLKLIMPHRRILLSGRTVLFLISTIALGPGLAVNVIAKDHWGRPRPIEVREMGGGQTFMPWWDPRGTCRSNCSFVSGDVAGAFWTLAPAALTPAPWRPLAYAGALALGSGVGLIRMVFGGHFFTDVVFAGVITFVIIWLTYQLLYRWQATRLSDEAIERAIERAARPRFLFGRTGPQQKQPGLRHPDAKP